MRLNFIKKAIGIAALALLAGSASAQFNIPDGKFADRFVSKRKGSAFGFNINNATYNQDNFFFPTPNQSNIGLGLWYWQGLSNHVDFSARLNGLFTEYTKAQQFGPFTILGELEAALHLRMFSDDHLFNPFISAGIGAGTYSESIVPYVPAGLGLQVNLFNDVYVMAQANYRFSLDEAKLDHNMQYSLGVAVPISNAAPKVFVPKDTDGDGVVDTEDQCPLEAGPIALFGCPDKDNDGIADKDDKCPTVAGVAKYNGCPIPDSDGDGINDDEDKCPTVAGVAKYNGCPIPDTDGDGVNDEEDKCPTVAGPASNKGCPELTQEVRQKLDVSAKNIHFESAKAQLKPQSYKVLDDIVNILNEYNQYNLDIDGHTDSSGDSLKNQNLSEARAQAVVDYLISKGISANRLQAAGYGQTLPIADNKTVAGRAQNRRVELKLYIK